MLVENMQTLQQRLEDDLEGIIDALSTSEIPLVNIENIYRGYFDPIGKSLTPSIFIVDNGSNKIGDDETYNTYQMEQNVSLYIVTSQTTSDSTLASDQLARYCEAVIRFINIYYDEYDLSNGDTIECFEALGADSSKRWAEIKMMIKFDVEL